MYTRKSLFAAGGLIVASLAAPANAASPLSYSMTDLIGYSPSPATQNTLAAFGLQFASTAGPDLTTDPTVAFEGNGARFGAGMPGDGGRNYIRTSESDFATVSFVAEVTFLVTSTEQSFFLGLGAGDIALWGTPDWSTQTSSASFWIESSNDGFYRFRTHNDTNVFQETAVADIYNGGFHRFRMTFDATTKELLGEIDLNYAGGPFVADATTGNAATPTTGLFAPDGWLTEPSRIFFGGDDRAIFTDLSVSVVPEPAVGAFVLMAAWIGCGTRHHRRQGS